MSWKGTMRSMAAAGRAVERARAQRERQHLRQYRENVKRHELASAATQARSYQAYVDALTSVHRETTTDVMDWEAIAAGADAPQPPTAPVRTSAHEDAALESFRSYTPGLLDRMLGRTERRRAALEGAVAEAAARDTGAFEEATEAHGQALREHAKELEEAAQERSLAGRVLAGDLASMEEVMNRLEPFVDLADFGSAVNLSLSRPDDLSEGAESVQITATIKVLGKEAIPAESMTLLKSGKLSVKTLSPSTFNAIHQDYVCGAVLRVANELLSLLPVPSVIVTATDEMLNASTGHIDDTAILSVYAPRRTMEKLSLAALDPSDSLSNFLHRMVFRKTAGFGPVLPLTWTDMITRAADN